MRRRICFECREFWLTGVDECPQCNRPGEIIEDETLEMIREIWSDVVAVSDDEPSFDRFAHPEDAIRAVREEGLTLTDAIESVPIFVTDLVWEPNRWIERIDILDDGSIERRVLDLVQMVSSYFRRGSLPGSEWRVHHKPDMDADDLVKLGDLWLVQMDMRATNQMIEGQYGVC